MKKLYLYNLFILFWIFIPFSLFAQLEEPLKAPSYQAQQDPSNEQSSDLQKNSTNIKEPLENESSQQSLPKESQDQAPSEPSHTEPSLPTKGIKSEVIDPSEPQKPSPEKEPLAPSPTIVEEKPLETPKEEKKPELPHCDQEKPISICLTDDVISSVESINGIEPPYSNFYGFKKAPYSRKFSITKALSFQVVRKWAYPRIIWFHIHTNEGDAKETLLWAVNNIGGYGLYINNLGNPLERNIRFRVPRVSFIEMDPNRMFTQRGMVKSLEILNKRAMSSKVRYRRIFNYTWRYISKPSTAVLLRYWNKSKPLVALHNNRLLTIEDYLGHEEYDVAITNEEVLGNFVFTVSKAHFEILKKHHINVVYQKKIAHDGSLSDYALLKKLPYVNIETRIGNPEIQKKLVFWVTYLLFPKQFDSSQMTPKKTKAPVKKVKTSPVKKKKKTA